MKPYLEVTNSETAGKLAIFFYAFSMADAIQPLKFFVYVVESPSAPDLYHQRSESELIRRAVNLNAIACVSRCAISRMAFTAALQVGLPEEMERFNGLLPILHISAHGSADGPQLSNNELVSWHELSELLIPINRALKSNLVVAMSCCKGYMGTRMAMRDEQSELPFFALIGSPEKPTWAETAVGFSTLYHQLARGAHVRDAVVAMCAASGRDTFFVEWGEGARQGWLEYMKHRDVENAQQSLADNAGSSTPDETAKMALLEKGRRR
jgi:hypothetical protein